MKRMRLFSTFSMVMVSVLCSVVQAQDLSATRPRRVKEVQQQLPANPVDTVAASNSNESESTPTSLAPWVRLDRTDPQRAMEVVGERLLRTTATLASSVDTSRKSSTETKPSGPYRQTAQPEDKKKEDKKVEPPTAKDECEDARDAKHSDCRDGFEASAYVGYAIDTFAAGDLRKYLNPNDSGGVTERFVGGFDFAYRLFGDPMQRKNDAFTPQLWVYGETVHGVRSADVDCKANPKLAVCQNLLDPVNAPDATLFILRNATSLEAFAGFRYEFKGLNSKGNNAANLYLKGQLGFLTVADGDEDVIDVHHVALGAIMTKGKYEGSYLEAGFGKTDLFKENRNRRFKVDGFLSWELPGALKNRVRPFAQMTVDADLRKGADSIQSYFGLDFDVVCLFKAANDCFSSK